MRVICIVYEAWHIGHGPKYGEVVTANSCLRDNYWSLDEYQSDYYLKIFFIPLSTIDETTFERNYNKELV